MNTDERQHLEMMAATLAAPSLATPGYETDSIVKGAVALARAIQAEVAATEQGVSDA
jgi:hypothetical protein